MRLPERPLWRALTTGWAPIAQGDGRAWRLPPSHGVFGAAADRSPDSQAALAALVPDGGQLWLLERESWPAPPGTRCVRTGELVQMVAPALTSGLPPVLPAVPLGERDAAEMLALARLTQPGPFAECTHRFGGFVGVRDAGRLVAMAGQRMALPGMREVSGVCTHPDYRGRGLAAALMRQVAAAMLARGETPFLTAYAANRGAIALYERLGFRKDGELVLSVIERVAA